MKFINHGVLCDNIANKKKKELNQVPIDSTGLLIISIVVYINKTYASMFLEQLWIRLSLSYQSLDK